jgi:hypothetical protein
VTASRLGYIARSTLLLPVLDEVSALYLCCVAGAPSLHLSARSSAKKKGSRGQVVPRHSPDPNIRPSRAGVLVLLALALGASHRGACVKRKG